MSAAQKDGGAAFPVIHDPERYAHFGMSLRDWFAGQALASNFGRLMDNPKLADSAAKGTLMPYAAKMHYMMADAMLAERAKSK